MNRSGELFLGWTAESYSV